MQPTVHCQRSQFGFRDLMNPLLTIYLTSIEIIGLRSYRLNRTMVGLKDATVQMDQDRYSGLNRTMVGLKGVC